MEINQEQALKNIDKGFEELKIFHKKIESHFSSIQKFKEFKESYSFINFITYLNNIWSLENGGDFKDFLFGYKFFGLSERDKFLLFYNHYKGRGIIFFKLKGNNKISDKYNINDFFEQDIYLKIDEKELKVLSIVRNKSIPLKDFNKYFYGGYLEDIFETTYFTYYENELIDCHYKYDKKFIINILSYLYSALGDTFEINEKMFNKKQKIHFGKFLISYYYVGFIDIEGIGLEHKKTIFSIKILPKLGKILDEIEEKRELIMDRVFDEKYKELKLKKKNGKAHLLEGKLEFIGDENKYVELKKQYPNSKITGDNYKGKTNKYEVIEKIKLDNSDNNI